MRSRLNSDGSWSELNQVQITPLEEMSYILKGVAYNDPFISPETADDKCLIAIQEAWNEKKYFNDLISEFHDLRFSNLESQRKYCHAIYSNCEDVQDAIHEFDKEYKGFLSTDIYVDMIDKITRTFEYRNAKLN